MITDQNYEIAKKKLKERYDNTRSIIRAHLKALSSFPPVETDSAMVLRKLLETSNDHVRSLESLGETINDVVLVFWISEKMDTETHKQFELAHPGKDAITYAQLSAFLENRCRALEFSETSNKKEEKPVMQKQVSYQVKLNKYQRDVHSAKKSINSISVLNSNLLHHRNEEIK